MRRLIVVPRSLPKKSLANLTIARVVGKPHGATVRRLESGPKTLEKQRAIQGSAAGHPLRRTFLLGNRTKGARGFPPRRPLLVSLGLVRRGRQMANVTTA